MKERKKIRTWGSRRILTSCCPAIAHLEPCCPPVIDVIVDGGDVATLVAVEPLVVVLFGPSFNIVALQVPVAYFIVVYKLYITLVSIK